MTQTLFICAIYIQGFSFALLFKKRIPFPFICLTGFLWGCTLYVIEAVGLLSLGFPYSLISMAVLSGTVLAILELVNLLMGNWKIGRKEVTWLAASLLIFFLGGIATELFSRGVVTIDSFNQVMIGREIAFDGFSPAVINYMSVTGPFMLMLHSASVFIGSEYLYTLLPSFSLSFFMVFAYITYRSISQKLTSSSFALVFAILSTLVLFTSDMFFFQSFYIHTNLPAAAYLFVAVGVSWLAIREKNGTWLAFTVPSLVSFSIMRTETFLFSIFILFLVVSLFKLPTRLRWSFTLPFLGLMFFWYLLFYLRFVQDTSVLSPARILLLMVLLVCFVFYIFALRYPKIEGLVRAILFYVIAGGTVILLAGMLIFERSNTTASLLVTLQNMFVFGRWGAIWYVVLAGLGVALMQPSFEDEKFLVLILAVYFVFLIALGSIRTLPYHLGRFDSGNRMLTHILPLAVYYLILKFAPATLERASKFEAWWAENKPSSLQSRS